MTLVYTKVGLVTSYNSRGYTSAYRGEPTPVIHFLSPLNYRGYGSICKDRGGPSCRKVMESGDIWNVKFTI